MQLSCSIVVVLVIVSAWPQFSFPAQAPALQSGQSVSASTAGQTEKEVESRFVSQVQNALALKTGAVVADIGAGDSPELALQIFKAIGDSGKVIFVDIDEKALEKLNRNLKEKGATNVQIQMGKADDPMLPVTNLDAVLISNAYHEMPEHAAMLAHIRKALRPSGRLVVIESISEKNRGLPRELQVKDHELSPEILERELRAAGFASRIEPLIDRGGVLRYLASARATE